MPSGEMPFRNQLTVIENSPASRTVYLEYRQATETPVRLFVDDDADSSIKCACWRRMPPRRLPVPLCRAGICLAWLASEVSLHENGT